VQSGAFCYSLLAKVYQFFPKSRAKHPTLTLGAPSRAARRQNEQQVCLARDVAADARDPRPARACRQAPYRDIEIQGVSWQDLVAKARMVDTPNNGSLSL